MKVTQLALILVLGATACSADYTNYYFAGRVYNGVDGTRLVKYDIELQFLDREIEGTVDSDGRYFVGPLTPFNDYTIAIRADGFRSFLSHNAMKVDDELSNNKNPADDNDHPDESQYFDAYLYPTDVVAPAVTFTITENDGTDAPSGTIRLTPAGSSQLLQTPASIASQVWHNDDDLQFSTVTRAFTGGTITFAAGELIYGVTYVVTIFGVDGHAPLTDAYTAGTGGDASFVVDRQTTTPLTLSFVSTQLGEPDPKGDLVFIFNQPVIFDPLGTSDEYLKSLEANFSIDSPDANNNGTVNALKPYDPAAMAGSLGLSMTLDGTTLTLSWNAAQALATTDNADPIVSVTYGGLVGVVLRPVNGQATDSMTLQALVGAPSILVPVTP